MPLYTKCIEHPVAEADGRRYSVMSRHTLNDGITPHPNFSQWMFHAWLRTLAPPENIVGRYHRQEISWYEFRKKYLASLRKPEKQTEVENLARQGLEAAVTILCLEETAEFCHRRLLAEECQRLVPALVIEHR